MQRKAGFGGALGRRDRVLVNMAGKAFIRDLMIHRQALIPNYARAFVYAHYAGIRNPLYWVALVFRKDVHSVVPS
mgnify:CR=1 FL=1